MGHEVLPGIGAFVLRPEADGKASSASVDALRDFLSDILDHLAAEGTALERNRFWVGQSAVPSASARFDWQPFLQRPAQDTSVLLGFVKSSAHLEWVLRSRLYNLRADPARPGAVTIGSDVLSTELLVLYNAELELSALVSLSGMITLRSRSDLMALGYPQPAGEHYFCATVEDELNGEIGRAHV